MNCLQNKDNAVKYITPESTKLKKHKYTYVTYNFDNGKQYFSFSKKHFKKLNTIELFVYACANMTSIQRTIKIEGEINNKNIMSKLEEIIRNEVLRIKVDSYPLTQQMILSDIIRRNFILLSHDKSDFESDLYINKNKCSPIKFKFDDEFSNLYAVFPTSECYAWVNQVYCVDQLSVDEIKKIPDLYIQGQLLYGIRRNLKNVSEYYHRAYLRAKRALKNVSTVIEKLPDDVKLFSELED